MPKNPKSLKFSYVIPAFNEEKYIASCIDSIIKQNLPAHEIIVVDNNSSDKTKHIANSYKQVQVLCEPRQGQKFAQATGFDAATGDVLVRIDADTRVRKDHNQLLQGLMNSHPAVSGFGDSYTGISRYSLTRILLWGFYTQEIAVFGSNVLWGANMAIAKQAWDESKVLLDFKNPNILEDLELAIALDVKGYKVHIAKNLIVGVDYIRMNDFKKYIKYTVKHANTVKLFRGVERPKIAPWARLTAGLVGIYTYPIMLLLITIYMAKFSLQKLIAR